MAIYDINFNIKAIEWLPVNKRYAQVVAFVQAALTPLQYLRDKYFGNYRTGFNAPQWIPSIYNINSVVIYKQVAYQSLVAGNTDQPPSAKWMVYLPSYIGTDTRIKFNGHYVVLTYALNKYFNVPPYAPCNFRQPKLLGYATVADATHARYSDIYITNKNAEIIGFTVGFSEGSTVTFSDPAGKTPWSAGTIYNAGDIIIYQGFMYVSLQNSNAGNTPPLSNWDGSVLWWKCDAVTFSGAVAMLDANFIIWVPYRIYNAIQNIVLEIGNFLRNIVPAGISYEVKPY